MLFTPETAREAAAKSTEARRERKANIGLNPLDAALATRARAIDAHLERLKAKLAIEEDAGSILRLCQAIDRLEQSWARYAGVAMPARGKPGRRSSGPTPGPIE